MDRCNCAQQFFRAGAAENGSDGDWPKVAALGWLFDFGHWSDSTGFPLGGNYRGCKRQIEQVCDGRTDRRSRNAYEPRRHSISTRGVLWSIMYPVSSILCLHPVSLILPVYHRYTLYRRYPFIVNRPCILQDGYTIYTSSPCIADTPNIITLYRLLSIHPVHEYTWQPGGFYRNGLISNTQKL